MTTMVQMRAMKQAARELAADEVLFDPTDDVILVAAAELARGCEDVDLARLSADERYQVIAAYDQCARVLV